MKLPEQFIAMLDTMPGMRNLPGILTDTMPEVAIRINPAKHPQPQTTPDRQVPWEPYGLYLDGRPPFTFDPDLYDGLYYVQDPSSMIVSEAIRRITADIDRPLLYLDACAAPGGKTTAAMAALPPHSFVLANEYDNARAAALVENLERWGHPDYAVSRGDARHLSKIGPIFDIVAADVPCSGEGMMRKNETAISQWSPSLIESCAALQREIVAALWETLRPGGFLIYSTCTFNTTENEHNAMWIQSTLGAQPIDLRLTDFPGVLPGIDTTLPCARFVPGHVRGEGQFIAVFRKPDNQQAAPRLRTTPKTTPLPPWLDSNEYAAITDRKGDLYAIARHWLPTIGHILANSHVTVPGLHVATPKGRDLVPAHALATSQALLDDAFPSVQVDYPTAIAFLRGEAICLDPNTPRGMVLITHGHARLGFAKNIGNRANNLVPASHRIRSTHAPKDKPAIL